MLIMTRNRFEKKYILSHFKGVVFRSDKVPKKNFNVYKTIKMIKKNSAEKYFEADRIKNIKTFFKAAGVTF